MMGWTQRLLRQACDVTLAPDCSFPLPPPRKLEVLRADIVGIRWILVIQIRIWSCMTIEYPTPPAPPSDSRLPVMKTRYNMQAEHGAERVAVVDIDVHHGNGTQAFFREDPTTFYASTHQVSAHDAYMSRIYKRGL